MLLKLSLKKMETKRKIEKLQGSCAPIIPELYSNLNVNLELGGLSPNKRC